MKKELKEVKEEHIALDILKFVLAIMVVAIHTKLFPTILYPWLRLAVPIFFIISAYFFFSSCNGKYVNLKKFILRNLKLYLFWFIVLLPVTLYIRNYFEYGILNGLLTIVKNFFFGSTFVASWFIMATIIAVTLIFILSKYIDNKVLLIITLLINIWVCLDSTYYPIFGKISFLSTISNFYAYFGDAVTSFPVALFWVMCGKFIADRNISIERFKKLFIGLLIISSLLLFIEWRYVGHMYNQINYDCYLFLIPTAIIIFLLVKEINLKGNIKIAKNLRKISTITYAVHGTLIPVVYFLLKPFKITEPIAFLIVVLLCIVGSLIIFKLEKIKYFKFLRYAH